MFDFIKPNSQTLKTIDKDKTQAKKKDENIQDSQDSLNN